MTTDHTISPQLPSPEVPSSLDTLQIIIEINQKSTDLKLNKLTSACDSIQNSLLTLDKTVSKLAILVNDAMKTATEAKNQSDLCANKVDAMEVVMQNMEKSMNELIRSELQKENDALKEKIV